MISGAAKIAQSDIWVCSSAWVRHPLPMRSMSGSCQCPGPAQAASRTLLARLAPASMMGEFFGLYALSGKATAFMAPLAVALLTSTFASQRAGISVILVFLVIGLGLLMFVREERAADLH